MATAYAAVSYLVNLMDQAQLYQDHHHPIFLNEQLRLIESLREKVGFLLDFLENYSHGGREEVQDLERQIAEVAYAAEDIIESRILDDVLAQSKGHDKRRSNHFSKVVQKLRKRFQKTTNTKYNPNQFSEVLEKVVENMDLLERKAMEMKANSSPKYGQLEDVVSTVSMMMRPSHGTREMVGFGDELISIMDKLTGGQTNLQIIPITGMGGIGKTTLAQNALRNPYIVEKFEIKAWASISQEYNIRETLLTLLRESGLFGKDQRDQRSSEHVLGGKLYKHLWGRRYLIVLDDMWSLEAWYKLKTFLPDNDNGSRIIVTTRLSEVADRFGSSNVYKMDLLNDDKSWILFCDTVFGEQGCPSEMEEIGKNIVRNCRGLPLSIVVIGSLLAKSKVTQEYWKYVSEHTNAIINSEDSNHCLKILSLSYSHLPTHLKPCFLYTGTVFPEDYEIHISGLIRLWVAEGFIKPHDNKSLEEVAKDYLKDLVDRNLILVRKWGSTGNLKTCGIHDLLRDLCIRESQEEAFLYVTKKNSHTTSRGTMKSQPRRFVVNGSMSTDQGVEDKSASTVRSLTCHLSFESLQLHKFKLLRVLNASFEKLDSCGKQLQKITSQPVNWRYIAFLFGEYFEKVPLPYLVWNLQTLIVRNTVLEPAFDRPIDIWKMPQLRHVDAPCWVPNPCPNNLKLVNLQTLKTVSDFRITQEVAERLPNIKKLSISYFYVSDSSPYCLKNLALLHKLESLTFHYLWPWTVKISVNHFSINDMALPHSLKKLYLSVAGINLPWDYTVTNIGTLPHLEKLRLMIQTDEEEWKPVEGQFLSLKFLRLNCLPGLERWTADSCHFPRLERLELIMMTHLKEIPSGIGDIPTLRSIELFQCRSSLVASAQEIIQEQRNLGNEDLTLITT